MRYRNVLLIGTIVIFLVMVSGCTEKSETIIEETTLTPTSTPNNLSTPMQTKIREADNLTEVTINEDLQAIEQYMINNENAIDVSYEDLVKFIRNDQTDKIPITVEFENVDSAITLHNNAEAFGIKTAIVYYDDEFYYNFFNAFNTTDRGLIYISSAGSSDPEFPCNNDLEYRNLEAGKTMTMYHLYKDSCWDEWNISTKSGIINFIEILW